MQKLATNQCRRIGLLLSLLTLPLFLISCGGSQADPVFNITGTWYIFHTTTGTPGQLGPDLFTFSQSDNNLSGTTSQSRPLSGTVSALNLNFSWLGSDGTGFTYTGTISADGNTMSGTWSSSNGQSGTWHAILNIAPSANVAGNWNIFHTITGTPGEQGPDLFAFTQPGNNISGTTSQGQSVTGIISGLSIILSWTGSDGTTNTYTGTVSGGNTMSGTWSGTNGQSGTWRAAKAS